MYYYKAIAGTPTFEKAKDWHENYTYLDNKVWEIIESLPYSIPENQAIMADRTGTHVIGIQLNEKPEGWKQVGSKEENFYYPKASNKKEIELLESINLPTRSELFKLFGYDNTYWGQPGYSFGDDVIGIIYHEDKTLYKVPSDLIEITRTEFENIG